MAAFTYDPATDIGRVRRYLGDTRAESAYFDDEEIQASLTVQGSVEGATWECAIQLASDSTKRASSRTEGNERSSRSIDDTKRPEYWLKIADRFEKWARAATPRVGVVTSRTPSDGTPITASQGIISGRRW